MRAFDLVDGGAWSAWGGALALLATTGCAPLFSGEEALGPSTAPSPYASPYAEVRPAPEGVPLLLPEDARGRLVVVRVPACCRGPVVVTFACAAAPLRAEPRAYLPSPYEDEPTASLPPKPSPYEEPAPPSPYGDD